mgnify:CR=1 FL=1
MTQQLGNQNQLRINPPQEDNPQVIEYDIPNSKSKFRQQRLPACRPFLTPLSASLVYFVFFIISLVFGLVYLKSSHDIFEQKIDYSEIKTDFSVSSSSLCVVFPVYYL